ncbi:MAG: hypothetical protein IPP88_15580 [Betaproteobacteria bacterium]|nr:hypothetical protein [Betaproteobacteria bacterium]
MRQTFPADEMIAEPAPKPAKIAKLIPGQTTWSCWTKEEILWAASHRPQTSSSNWIITHAPALCTGNEARIGHVYCRSLIQTGGCGASAPLDTSIRVLSLPVSSGGRETGRIPLISVRLA